MLDLAIPRPRSAAALVVLAACGSPAEEVAETDSEAAAARVEIVQPVEGVVIQGSAVRVVLVSENVEIAPAAEARPGTAHHHLYFDRDLGPLDRTIPADDPFIVHLGTGTADYTFEDVAPGAHRIIALLADPAHVPLDPPAADTVSFTVAGGS